MRWAIPWFVLCGAVAGWLIAGVVPPGQRALAVHELPFVLGRSSDDLLTVTPDRWFLLPFRFGDGDLVMTVELGEHVEAELLLRLVEPVIVGKELRPFTGRFTTLRMTTGAGDEVAWRSRDEALLGPHSGGVSLAPGAPATVWVQMRGRELHANVGGKVVGWHRADDTQGFLALVARGGPVVVHDFQVTPHRSRTWPWSSWFLAGIGALGAAALAGHALALGTARRWFWTGGVALVALAAWVGGFGDLDLAWPEPSSLLLLLAGTLLVVAASLARPWWFALLALLGGALTIALGERGLHHDTRTIDAVFGPDAGAQPSEALAQMLRGPQGLHDVGEPGPRVFLLGGGLLSDRGEPGQHLELLLGRELRARRRTPVDVPSLPTADGWPEQQWRLFAQCFAEGYRPQVVVFGVPADDARLADGSARTTPAGLARVLHAARAYCDAEAARLVLLLDAGVPADLREVATAVADERVPLVAVDVHDTPEQIARRLADAVEPLLPPR